MQARTNHTKNLILCYVGSLQHPSIFSTKYNFLLLTFSVDFLHKQMLHNVA